MYLYSIYLDTKVPTEGPLEGLSIYYMGTWSLWGPYQTLHTPSNPLTRALYTVEA